MKKIVGLILTLFSQVLFAEVNLYIKDSPTPYQIHEMEDILDKFQQIAPEKNILFYVHGRAINLEKNILRINQLEANYNVKVVMLKWDAWTGPLSRPTENARIASSYLFKSLLEIKKYKQTHPDYFENNKITFFCHSMGNLVLKNMIENYLDKYPELNASPIFDNFISVGADVPLVGHQNWLSQIKFAKSKYVTSNNRDGTLTKSYLLDLKKFNPLSYKLGLGLESIHGAIKKVKSNLDPKTFYLNFSKILKDEHAYYLSSDESISDVFSRLFNGEKFLNDHSLLPKLKIKRVKNIITLSR